MELLWVPEHGVQSSAGELLVENRRAFLSDRAVRASYTGYAIQQAKRLSERTTEGRTGFDPDLAKRTAKHGRHCLRLLRCGKHLVRTGELLVDVSHWRDELFAAGELAEQDPVDFEALFRRELAEMDDLRSVLPAEPGRGLVDSVVRQIRLESLR